MKTIYSNSIKKLLILFFLISSLLGASQTIVTLQPDQVGCVSGSSINVPVHLTGVGVYNMAFYLTYDPAKLTPVGYTALIPGLIPTWNAAFNPTTAAIFLDVTGISGVNFTNEKVIDIVFSVVGAGNTSIHLRNTSDPAPISGIWDDLGNAIGPVTYTDVNVVGYPILPVAVTITSNPVMPVCPATPVTFTADPGTSPTPLFYQWEVNSSAIPGATDATFTSSTLLRNDAVKVVLTSTYPCTTGNPATSNTIIVTFPYPDFVAGSASAPQTICYMGTANPLVAIPPTGGTTPYSYQWQNYDGFLWSAIPGATDLTYTPSGLTVTTNYRQQQQYTGVCGTETVFTNEVLITVYPQFVIGSISANQTICYNTVPAQLSGVAPTGGNIPYTYQWQNSTNNIIFSNIPGATDLNYQPGLLTTTTYYKQLQTSASGCGGPLETNVVTITVYPDFAAGVIGANEEICYNTIPAPLTFTTAPVGSGSFSYQWESSPDGTIWSTIAGASSAVYAPPALTATTQYKALVTDLICLDAGYTNVITKTVFPNFVVGSIAADQAICYNTIPAQLTGTAPTGGNTPYTYQWQSSPDNILFTDITGATSLNYAPPALTATTYYLQIQTSASGCGTFNTNVVTITVYPDFVVGSIAADQAICYNTVPAPLTGTAPTGGNTPYTYQWQSSPDNATFTDIPGATTINYAPAALTATTYYRQVQTSASGCGTFNTNVVTITVYPNFVVGSIAADQAICYNTIPAMLIGTAPTGGNTPYSYQWQSSLDNVTFTDIAGATSFNYAPAALTVTTFFRQVQTSASGCGTFNTNVVTITVYPNFVVGSIAADQAICYNTVPAPLTGTAPTGGNTPYTYQWQSSPDNLVFSNISGATSLNYAPGALTATTYYRQVQSSASGCGTLNTNVVTITVYPNFVVGSIAANQAICYNTVPAPLTGTAPTGGNTPYTYQWQSSIDNVTFTDITGATSLNYAPAALTVTTYFRQVQSSASGCGTFNTNVVTITVYPNFVVGSIAANQTICYNTIPAPLTGTAPTGGNTPYTYQWQISTDNVTFNNISGATSLNYAPGALTVTTYYRQVQSSASGCGTFNTNVVTITVYPMFVVGSIAADQAICYNTIPAPLTGTAPTGGNTPYTYQWQISTDNVTFTDITGATSLNYAPAALTVTTYFRQVQTSASGCGSLNTNVVTITVYPMFVVGSIAANQAICYNTIPAPLTGTAPTGGITPYTYQWQISTDNVTFTDITGATSLNYAPAALTATTYYRQIQTSAGGCGTANTNVVTITVYPMFVVGSIAADQSICYNTVPAPLTGTAPTGGNTPYAYQWQSSPDNVTFTDITGATNLNYAPAALTATTYFRLVQSSASGCGSFNTNVVTITVYPLPTVNPIADQAYCNNDISAVTTPTGPVPGTTFAWTNSNTAIGLPSGGTGTIPGVIMTNTTNAPISAVITITPTANGCAGTPLSYTIVVNPTPTVNTIADQAYCHNAVAPLTPITGPVAGTTYTWTNSNPAIGLAASGSGSIPSFTATNTGSGPITGTVTITPSFTNAGVTCTGPSSSYVITVNILPVPTITGPATVCLNVAGNVYTTEPGMTGYTWTVVGGTITAGAGSNAVTVTWTTVGPQTISVNYLNATGCTAALPVVYPVTVNALPTPTINGLAAVCAGTTGVAYNTQAGMTGYIWTISAGGTITSGAGSNNIMVTWNTPGAQTISVNYTNAQGCTAATPTVLPVTVHVLPVPTITGPASVCINSVGNIYTTEAGMTGYTWTVSAGGTITAGGASNAITVTWSTTGAKTVSVNYLNANNCTAPTPTVYNVTVNPLPVPTITGPASVCLNASGVVYTTQSGMTNYIWTVSAGGTITAGGTPTSNSITITWNTTGVKAITVNYTNANGCTAVAPTSYSITVNPLATPTIGSTNTPCVGSTNNIYYTESGMTGYVWTVSAGTIVSGQGTSSINVTWTGVGAQFVTVNYTNTSGCPASTPAVYNLFVNPFPAAAGAITGVGSVCAGTNGVAYSTTPVLNATSYTWTLPAGATIASGAGTTNITVNFGAAAVSGNVSVAGANSCGNGTFTNFPVTVNPLPAAAGTITGPASVCEGATGVAYSVPAIASATSYVWTVPAGATITSGATTNNIVVSFTTPASGIITVKGTNTCGSGAVSPNFNVTVNAIPAAPVVTAVGPVLTSSAPTGNQWYYGGTLIPGATGQSYTVTNNTGYYWVVVTINGCSSPISNKVWVEIVGIPELPSSASFSIYPVPNNGVFTASISYPVDDTFSIVVYNQLGSKLFELRDVKLVGGKFETLIDLRPVASGMYSVVFFNSEHKVVKKVLVNK